MGAHRRPNMVGRTLEQIVQLADLTGKVAIVTGATRGIGRETALALAKLGCNIVVAAKTTEPQPTLPGTIHTVAAEVEALGVKGLACRVDLRDIDSIQQCDMKEFLSEYRDQPAEGVIREAGMEGDCDVSTMPKMGKTNMAEDKPQISECGDGCCHDH